MIFFLVSYMTIAHNSQMTLRTTAWNMNCMYNSAGPYLHDLLNQTDILVVSEHGLFPCELYKLDTLHTDFLVSAKSSKQLTDAEFGHKRGSGGVAIMWHKNMCNFVVSLPKLGTDRMCVIQLQLQDTSKLFIVGVYMPHQNCKISNYRYELDMLAELIGELSATGNVLLIGDTKCHFGPEHGPRGWGRTTANGRAFIDVMYKCGMVMIDLDDKTGGPTYIYSFRKGRSYIDHCAITCDAFYAIRSCKVLADEIHNVSDHLAITAELQLSHMQAAQTNETRNTFKVACGPFY